MPRRSHTKSRLGCPECKRRHLKCDETKPACVNCTTAHIECSYRNSPDGTLAVPDTAAASVSTPSSGVGSVIRPVSDFATFNFSDRNNVAPLNLLHLELMYYWCSELHKKFTTEVGNSQLYGDLTIKHGLRHEFLMYQVLATTALYLSTRKPQQRDEYHRHSAQLQGAALDGFTAALQDPDDDNVIACFLCSSLIALHKFCDTFSYRQDSFSKTLESVLDCIGLTRGVKSVIGGHWDRLLTGELAPILLSAQYVHQQSCESRPELLALRAMIEQADMSSGTRSVYQAAIEELEKVFNAQLSIVDAEDEVVESSSSAIFTWLVVVNKQYADLLGQRRPEALVVLAYFAALLHHRRRFWAVGDAGAYLISSIDDYLGQQWSRWLEWPKAFVQDNP